MSDSAFHLLILPVLWATLLSMVMGAAMVGVMTALDALIRHLGRFFQSFQALSQAGHDSHRRTSVTRAHRMMNRARV